MILPYFYQLMLVTHWIAPIDEYLAFIKKCASAGITSVQLRKKNADYAMLFEIGSRLKEILTPKNIPLIINDHVELAVQLDADGVHLGQDDADPEHARSLLGPDKIIGLSIEDLSQLEQSNAYSLNYVAASAVFSTQNKSNIKTLWGLKGVLHIAQQSIYPVIGIGGINLNNVDDVLKAGAKGVAIIGAIHDAVDPISTIKKFREIIQLQ